MGGANSPQFIEFQKNCCKAYLVLRRSARTFLALLELTQHLLPAGGGFGTGKTGHKIMLERFKLHLTSEEAVDHLQDVIHQSLGAVFPQLVDTVHKWRQFFKQ
jgi:phosphatidylinositol 3-kinase